MPASQVMGLHSRTMKKFVQRFNALEEGKISAQLGDKEIVSPEMEPVVESLDKELVSTLCLKVCRSRLSYQLFELLPFLSVGSV